MKITPEQLDAVLDALKGYFDDQANYLRSGDMELDYDQESLASKATQLRHIADMLYANGQDGLSTDFYELTQEVMEAKPA